MSLKAHLDTMVLRRELAQLQGSTDNLETILADTNAEDVAAQADLGILIHLQRLREHYLEAEIELQEMGNVQGSRNEEPWDRSERRRTLEAAIKDWEESLERWKDEYSAVGQRLEQWQRETQPEDGPPDPEQGRQVTADAPEPRTEHVEPNYTSPLKIAIRQALMTDRTLSNRYIRQWIDENAPPEVCEEFKTKENPRGSLESANKNPEFRARIEQAISKVRSDMGIQQVQ
jgi:hypothetical protein